MYKRRGRLISFLLGICVGCVFVVGGLVIYAKAVGASIVASSKDSSAETKLSPKKTQLNVAVVVDTKDFFKPDERIKDYELSGGLVGGLVKEGDTIDLEYMKKDGSTYVILSKKKVKKRQENSVILQTTWEERQMINYGITEAAQNGGKITSSIYLDDTQPASKVTYVIPSNGVISKVDPVKAAEEPKKSEVNQLEPPISGIGAQATQIPVTPALGQAALQTPTKRR